MNKLIQQKGRILEGRILYLITKPSTKTFETRLNTDKYTINLWSHIQRKFQTIFFDIYGKQIPLKLVKINICTNLNLLFLILYQFEITFPGLHSFPN